MLSFGLALSSLLRLSLLGEQDGLDGTQLTAVSLGSSAERA